MLQALAVVAADRGVALEAPARADETFDDWRLRAGDHSWVDSNVFILCS